MCHTYEYVTNYYVCVQLYVTHGNVNVYAYIICDQVSKKRSYDMYEPYIYVTSVHYMK